MIKVIDVDCLYVNGDSWVYGSELIDINRPEITDHFHPIHNSYRLKNCWAQMLAELLRLEVVNGAEAGAGNDRILRTSIKDLAQLKLAGRKPLAVIGWSQLQRFELANGDHYRSFVGPDEHNVPSCVKDIWAKWSSDQSDVVRWVTQLISFHSFCAVNQIPVLGLSVFRTPYNLLEQWLHTEDFKPYLSQLTTVCELGQQQYHFSLESFLRQHQDVPYGPGGHPLKFGQELIANHLSNIIRQRFKIVNTQATV